MGSRFAALKAVSFFVFFFPTDIFSTIRVDGFRITLQILDRCCMVRWISGGRSICYSVVDPTQISSNPLQACWKHCIPPSQSSESR